MPCSCNFEFPAALVVASLLHRETHIHARMHAHTHTVCLKKVFRKLCRSLLLFLQSLHCVLGVLQMQRMRKSVHVPNMWECCQERSKILLFAAAQLGLFS